MHLNLTERQMLGEFFKIQVILLIMGTDVIHFGPSRAEKPVFLKSF